MLNIYKASAGSGKTYILVKEYLKKSLSSKINRHISANKIIVTDHPYNFLNDPDKDSLNIPYWILSFLREKFLRKNLGKI